MSISPGNVNLQEEKTYTYLGFFIIIISCRETHSPLRWLTLSLIGFPQKQLLTGKKAVAIVTKWLAGYIPRDEQMSPGHQWSAHWEIFKIKKMKTTYEKKCTRCETAYEENAAPSL